MINHIPLTYCIHVSNAFCTFLSVGVVWKGSVETGSSNRLTPHSARDLAHPDVDLEAHVAVVPTLRVAALEVVRTIEGATVGPGRP